MENEKYALEFLDKNYAKFPEIHDAYEQLKNNVFELIKDRLLPVFTALGIDIKKAKPYKSFDRNSIWYGFNHIKHPKMWDLEGGLVFEDGSIVLKVYVDIKREGVNYKEIVAKIEKSLSQDSIEIAEIKAGHLLYIRYQNNEAQYPIKDLISRFDQLCKAVQRSLESAFK